MNVAAFAPSDFTRGCQARTCFTSCLGYSPLSVAARPPTTIFCARDTHFNSTHNFATATREDLRSS